MIKRGILIILAIVFTFLIAGAGKAEVITSLNITPSNFTPPDFLADIPTQTWAINTNITDAFDLDDYFYDEETLSYNYSSVSNISVAINSTTHLVSFYSDYGFEGLRGVVFTAYDTFSSTQTNNITLNVTNDSIAPQWSNPSKDKVIIYQNSLVKFTTDWQDNIALSRYIFSIKQEGGWTNYSSVAFSGKQSISNYSVQISAPSGQVYWQFHAFDTSGNLNSTAIQNFSVTSISAPAPSSSPSSSNDEGNFLGSLIQKKGEGNGEFTTDPTDSFHIEIIQGESAIITIKVTNEGESLLDFEIEIAGLEELEKTISDTIFNVSSQESKSVSIEFKSGKDLAPDVYYGVIEIKTVSGIKEIPIVIIVKTANIELGLKVVVAEEYKNVRPGNILRANITLENLKDIQERNINFYYAITDFRGNVVDSASEEFIFSARSQVLEKEFIIPKKIERGEYIFLARAVSGDEIAIDSDTFTVGESFNVAGFIKTNFLIIILILSSITVALLMAKHHKSKERLRLLNLYMMVNQLNKLIQEGKHDEAIDIYVRIKSAYGEPVSQTALENKDLLIKEMKKLAETINSQLSNRQAEIQPKTAQPQIKIEENKVEIKNEANKNIITEIKKEEIKEPEKLGAEVSGKKSEDIKKVEEKDRKRRKTKLKKTLKKRK